MTRKPAAKVRYAVTNRDLYLSHSIVGDRRGIRTIPKGSPAIIAEEPEVPGGSTALVVFWGTEAVTIWTEAAAYTEAGTFVAVAEDHPVTRDRCRSQWRQMPSQPVIRCARNAGHPVTNDGREQHYNTRQQRQWLVGNVEEAAR